MVRILGEQLDNNKVVRFALLKIYGIGISRATKICKALNIEDSMRVKDLSDQMALKIQSVAKELNYLVQDDLRRQLLIQKKMLSSIRCYRGERERRGLPRRGQRTKSNARTVRRNRRS